MSYTSHQLEKYLEDLKWKYTPPPLITKTYFELQIIEMHLELKKNPKLANMP